MYDFSWLEDGLSLWNISLSDKQKHMLGVYYDMLIKRNKAVNLTAVTGFEDVCLKHFLDSAAEIELIDAEKKEFILKKETESIRGRYDFVIIDCPPSLSMLTLNAMTTADTVMVPIQCEYYALEGLSQLVHTIGLVRERLNPALEIEGIVFTMYDGRTNLSAQVVENVRENVAEHIFSTLIPRSIRLAEAPSFGKPINLYEPKSGAAEAYRLLAKEVIARKFEEKQRA